MYKKNNKNHTIINTMTTTNIPYGTYCKLLTTLSPTKLKTNGTFGVVSFFYPVLKHTLREIDPSAGRKADCKLQYCPFLYKTTEPNTLS